MIMNRGRRIDGSLRIDTTRRGVPRLFSCCERLSTSLEQNTRRDVQDEIDGVAQGNSLVMDSSVVGLVSNEKLIPSPPLGSRSRLTLGLWPPFWGMMCDWDECGE